MRRMKFFYAIAAIVLFSAPVSARAAAPCRAAVYHQFDFFLGNWTVKDRSGKVIGSDVVTKRMNGCVVFEQWKDANGPGTGFGISGVQAGRHGWHQTFMDDGGLVLTLDGMRAGNTMRLRGHDYPARGQRLHDVTWMQRGAIVEEVWKMSGDDGKHWKTVFDGFFYRA